MARGRKQQQAAAADGEQDAPQQLPKGAVVDPRSERVFVPMDTVSSDLEPVQSTDSVAEVLAGNYSEGIVDEVGGCLLCVLSSSDSPPATCMSSRAAWPMPDTQHSPDASSSSLIAAVPLHACSSSSSRSLAPA
jgi:hypothetical protein